jgi:hypothetical protein
VPEPEELTQCPYHDEELNSDSYLSPAFSSHEDILTVRATGSRQIGLRQDGPVVTTKCLRGPPSRDLVLEKSSEGSRAIRESLPAICNLVEIQICDEIGQLADHDFL